MAEDIITALRGLANRWALKARDFARQSKEAGENEAQAQYNRGYAEGYYKAATELAALIKEQETALAQQPKPSVVPPLPAQGGRRAVMPATQPLPVKPQAASTVTYASISVSEVLSILSYSGCEARDVIQNKDNSFHAIFSRWENMMPHDRLERIRNADNRIVILANGKLETHDHFVDFAFKED